MGSLAIEAAPEDGSPFFLVNQDTGDMNTAHLAVRQAVSSKREGASIDFSPTHWLPGSKPVESSRGRSRFVSRAFVAAGVCVLWLFIGAVRDNGLGGESDARAQGFVAPTEKGLAAQALQSAAAGERKQALEHKQEWDRAEALARAL